MENYKIVTSWAYIRGFQLLLSTWDLTHASLSSSEQWFAYFIHVDNETRVYIYCINFCQTIMVPFTVCLPLIIFRWKYMWQTTLMNFASQGVVGFVSSFLCTRQVRASNISRSRGAAKSHEIHKNAKNTPKFGRNLIRYMSVQLIWNLFQLLGLFTCHKLPNLSYADFVTEMCKQHQIVLRKTGH